MRFTSHAAIAISLAAFGSAAAQAQATDPAADGAESAAIDSEIVVTAQKRAESISDVPLTVSALSGEALKEIGVDEFDEVAAYIPGLIVQEQSPNNPGFVIRGITSDSGSAQIAPRVSIYYNGIDVSRSRGSYFDLFDIERIEVVKGPQATLFGTASTIGAISVITNRPTPEESASASVSYGNLNAVQANAVVNGGTEFISGRLAAVYKYRDGYVRNIGGQPGTVSGNQVGIEQDDLNGVNQFGVRGSIRINPAAGGHIDFIATYEQQRNPGTAFKSGTLPPTGGDTSPYSFAELGGSPFSESVLGLPKLGLNREVYDANLSIEFPIGDAWQLDSITGYRKFDSLEVFDADGSGLFFLEFAEDAKGQQMSHETRISYDSDRFRGFAGFNIFHEEGTQGVPFSTDEGTYIACAPFPAFAPVQAVLSGAQGGANPCYSAAVGYTAPNASAILTRGAASIIPYSSVFENGGKNTSYSVFADGTAIFGLLELTAGLRYLYEERQSTYFSRQPGSQVFAGLGVPGVSLLGAVDTAGQTFRASDDFDAFLPRFNALYRVTRDVNVYATISKGRRSPVLNLTARGPRAGETGPQPSLTIVDAETVWNYEGGIKGSFGGFTGSIGAFYQDYSNFQTSLITQQDTVDQNGNPIPAGTVIPVNAGQASNFGIEVETSYRVSRALRLFANYAYIDAKIGEPAEGTASQFSFQDSRFRLTPEHSASGGIEFNADLGGGTAIFFTPTATYQSRVFFEVPNDPSTSQDGYVLVNLRGGVTFDDGRYEISGFARNLLGKDYLIDAGNTGGSFGTTTYIAGEPRLYGVQLAARF
ncbi:TonB-dependent receptor [Novosphingopyxis sp. YJ-S2-01]|uniref:TonB-dependent receptor n=1 Tax=Novosphingopyxis sp. YJ-S2-01 TaxID=2794021 RepID=UPI0018DBE810|nr:TonB-dependent receptor [Novosphingopyxis sp. YJ-S2-01]MBH9537343.1 TonB-dependent receptor [Novosphingopyxis sp. YJ-S2-01]